MHPDEQTAQAPPSELPHELRLLIGVLIGAALAGISVFAAVETQVVLLREYAKEKNPNLPGYNPETWVTWPRQLYRRFHFQLVLPALIGALAGLAYARSRFRKTLAFILISTIPAYYAAAAWYTYTTDYKPSIDRDVEQAIEIRRKIRHLHETGRRPEG